MTNQIAQCGTCFYFVNIEGETIGTCHKNAPIPFNHLMTRSDEWDLRDRMVVAMWPTTNNISFCGEYELKETFFHVLSGQEILRKDDLKAACCEFCGEIIAYEECNNLCPARVKRVGS